jgi:hypothetical protein
MAQRFPGLRRRSSLGLSVLVLLLGAAYLLYFRSAAPPNAAALQEFRNGCVKAARRANGGGDLVMDEATEAKIGAYCGCVGDAIQGNVAPAEIAKLANDGESDATRALLGRIISGCRAQLQ